MLASPRLLGLYGKEPCRLSRLHGLWDEFVEDLGSGNSSYAMILCSGWYAYPVYAGGGSLEDTFPGLLGWRIRRADKDAGGLEVARFSRRCGNETGLVPDSTLGTMNVWLGTILGPFSPRLHPIGADRCRFRLSVVDGSSEIGACRTRLSRSVK